MRLYEFSQDSRNFYLVTELCEGGELLDKILALRSFNERLAARIMKQVFSAVAYCHTKHIVHRFVLPSRASDLKPENLVLEAHDIESNLKVIDFGTSKVFKPRERLKEILGTVRDASDRRRATSPPKS